jgi:hypothetical protein
MLQRLVLQRLILQRLAGGCEDADQNVEALSETTDIPAKFQVLVS